MWTCPDCGREFHLHALRLVSPDDVDDRFRAWMGEVYRRRLMFGAYRRSDVQRP